MRYSLSILLLAAACIPIRALAQTIVERAQQDEITYMSSEEPAMRAAFAKARATLDEFLATASRPGAGTSNYALKVAISDGRNTEYFWVGDFAATGERFRGTLNNEPRLVKTHKLGETIVFGRSQIADWTYVDPNGPRMVGNFTGCALLSKEPPAQAAEFRRRYGLQCE